MLDWLFASPAQRRLLGGSTGVSGPTPWLIAIMSFSMVLVATAGLAISNMAGGIARSAEGRFSLLVPDGERGLPGALEALKTVPGIEDVAPVPESEMRATLQRWLGDTATSRDLPVPALVTFDAGPGADIGMIRQRVSLGSPGATVVAHSDNLKPLLNSLNALRWLSLGLVAMLAAASAAAVVLAARGALDTHRFTIEVMHGMGATDLQVTRLFQRKVAIDSFVGSIAGAAAAAAVLLLFSASATALGELSGGAQLTAGDFILLLLLPLALTALATWIGRATVLRALRQAL